MNMHILCRTVIVFCLCTCFAPAAYSQDASPTPTFKGDQRLIRIDDPAPPKTPADTNDGSKVLGWTLASFSVFNVAAALLLANDVQHDLDELRTISATVGGDRARYDTLKSKVSQHEQAAWVFAGVGTVSALASGILLSWAYAQPDHDGEAQRLELWLTPTTAGVAGYWD